MTTELMELRPDWTVAQAMDAIRKNGFDKETINNCYVTDRDRTLIGVVSLRALVLSKDPQNEIIRDMMDDNVVSVATTTDQEDVSQMFEKYGYLAIPLWTTRSVWSVSSPSTTLSRSCRTRPAKISPR